MTTQVDLDALGEAFADASADLAYFVDRVTGEVILVSDTLGFIEAGQQRIAMAQSAGRYPAVPITGADDLEGDVEAYLDTVQEGGLAAALEDALDGAELTKAVAAVFAKREGARQAWEAFRAERFRERAREWLKEQELFAEE